MTTIETTVAPSLRVMARYTSLPIPWMLKIPSVTIAPPISAPRSVPIRVITGLRRNGFLDNLVLVTSLFLLALPTFVTGFVLKWLFGFKLGWVTPTVTSASPTFAELLLPGFVLSTISLAYVARLARTSIAENRRADYVRTAIAKGLPHRRVIGIHLLRNS